MKQTVQPLRFDVRKLIAKGRRTLNKRVAGAQIRLPGFTFSVAPVDPEVKVARQLMVWLADRRVLTSKECCDGCIDSSLSSLLKIREYLVAKQVELADLSDGPLFFLIEFMAQGVRQFLTYEERLKMEFTHEVSRDSHRPYPQRDRYFDALAILRQHFYWALQQLAIIADMPLPSFPDYLRIQSFDASYYITDVPEPT
jgi:hypothetical protein